MQMSARTRAIRFSALFTLLGALGFFYVTDRQLEQRQRVQWEASWELYRAIHANDPGAVRGCLDRDPTLVNKMILTRGSRDPNHYPLPMALKLGHLEVAHLLIESGADPNAGNPLVTATETGNIEFVERLLALGADPNLVLRLRRYPDGFREYTAVDKAKAGADVRIVELLESHGGVALGGRLVD